MCSYFYAFCTVGFSVDAFATVAPLAPLLIKLSYYFNVKEPVKPICKLNCEIIMGGFNIQVAISARFAFLVLYELISVHIII